MTQQTVVHYSDRLPKPEQRPERGYKAPSFQYLCINLRRSRDGTVFDCSGVCYLPRSSFHSVHFGQLLRCEHIRIDCQCNESVHRKQECVCIP